MKVLSTKYYFRIYFMHYLDAHHSINLNIHTYFIVTFIDQRDLKCLLFQETVARVLRACKKNFLFYRRNRCSTGRSCSKADQRLTRVSFSFVKIHFFGQFSQLFLRASNRQLVGKMKPGREFDSRLGHENFLCPGQAWFLLLPS